MGNPRKESKRQQPLNFKTKLSYWHPKDLCVWPDHKTDLKCPPSFYSPQWFRLLRDPLFYGQAHTKTYCSAHVVTATLCR